MSDSVVGVSTGTDKYLNSQSRTVGGTAVDEQVVHEGWTSEATYSVISDDASVATANDHILQIMADGTNYTRLVHFTITETEDGPASAGYLKLALYRLSTAGTGGTAITASAFDSADTYGGDCRQVPTSKGTEGALLWTGYLSLAQTPASSAVNRFEWTMPPGGKPIIFGTGTGAGVAFKVIDAVASASVIVRAEIVVTSYL